MRSNKEELEANIESLLNEKEELKASLANSEGLPLLV